MRGLPLGLAYRRAGYFGRTEEWHASAFAKTLFLLLALGLSACGTIPQTEFTAYRAAFGQARTMGESLILDFDAARAETNRRVAARNPAAPEPVLPEIPLTYIPPQLEISTITDTKVRLLLWQTINEYNVTLAALASGERVEEVQSSAGQLVDLVSKLGEIGGKVLPGAGALTALAKDIAGQIEMARTAAEFRNAVLGGVPIVRRMLDNCLKDAADHYRLRALLAEADFRRVDIEPGLDEPGKRLKQARIKAAMDEFRLSLDNYYRLIDQLNRTMTTLQAAVNKPADFSAQTSRILDVALDLKQHWVAYQDARSAVSSN
jgi:hypothetical protein